MSTGFEERADGFYKAIRKNGMSTSRSIVHQLTPSIDGAYSDMKELLKNNVELSTCYFADNDLIAAGALRALTEAGYRIPHDISIIGFDDMPLCTYTIPALTTIHVHHPIPYNNTCAKTIHGRACSKTTCRDY